MSISRRNFISSLLVLIASSALSRPRHYKYNRPYRLRPFVRNRGFRHRALWRIVRGKRLLIVPTTISIGQELIIDGGIVIVKDVQKYKIVVEHQNGIREIISTLKEDKI